jgi:diaminopropionate ammonia-lyase
VTSVLPAVRALPNPHRVAVPGPDLVPPADPAVRAFHRTLPGYAPTPLRDLPGLAHALGVGQLWLKDESRRLGLPAFKVLGASWAMHALVEPGRPATFATATAGNHGRAVAWAARVLGQRAVIFVPAGTAPARMAAIRGEGAEVLVVDGTYDAAVTAAAAESAARGWRVVSDTAYPGYTEVPERIMAGYETLFAEVTDELAARDAREPDVVLLQAGVGGFAAAGARSWVRRRGAARPRLVVVEPTEADGFLESARAPSGELRPGRGGQRTIMAGLNASVPSLVAWPVLRAAADVFLAVADPWTEEAMRLLRAGSAGDVAVVAGESGAAGVAGLLALARHPDLAGLRRDLGLGPATAVLAVSTEGATDPASYRRIVGADPG